MIESFLTVLQLFMSVCCLKGDTHLLMVMYFGTFSKNAVIGVKFLKILLQKWYFKTSSCKAWISCWQRKNVSVVFFDGFRTVFVGSNFFFCHPVISWGSRHIHSAKFLETWPTCTTFLMVQKEFLKKSFFVYRFSLISRNTGVPQKTES